jgi:hypothetical protein
MTTLDEYADRFGLRFIRLLKLDLEGAELGALEGALDLLKRRRVEHVVCELNTYLLDLSGERYDERRALLASCGYRCYQLTKSGRIVAQDEPIVTRDVVVTDLLFAA